MFWIRNKIIHYSFMMNNLNEKNFIESLEYNYVTVTTILSEIFEVHMISIYSKNKESSEAK